MVKGIIKGNVFGSILSNDFHLCQLLICNTKFILNLAQ